MKVVMIKEQRYYLCHDVVIELSKIISDARNFFMNTYCDTTEDPDINDVCDYIDDMIYESIRRPLVRHNIGRKYIEAENTLKHKKKE